MGVADGPGPGPFWLVTAGLAVAAAVVGWIVERRRRRAASPAFAAPLDAILVPTVNPIMTAEARGVIQSPSSSVDGAIGGKSEQRVGKLTVEMRFGRDKDLMDCVENGVIAVHSVGPDGRILWANEAELKLLGYARDDYVGHNLREFHVDQEAAQDMLERLGRNETIKDVEAQLRCKDGSDRYVLISSNVRWKEGRFMHTRCFTRDITDRRQAEMELRESEERLRLLIENVKEYAIFMLDLDGRVTSWNAGAKRIIGYSADEIVGREVACMFLPDEVTSGKPEWILRTALENGRYDEEGWRVRKDGVRFWANVVTTALRDDGGELRGFSAIIRDDSERKRADHAAEERTQEMEAFLSIAAHDLRRPLVSVQGLLAIMQEDSGGRLGPENQQLLTMALEECSHMRQLLKELDKLVQIERATISREPSNLRRIVETCVQRYAERIAALAVDLRVDCPDVEVVAAHTQVEEALTNLVENALLYGCPADGARLDIRGLVGASFASLSVTDYGPGIPPEHHQRVFQLFRRLDPSGPVAGSGVGLASVLRLIRRIGGTVGLHSDLGKGATFTISFPVEQAEPSEMAVRRIRGFDAPSQRPQQAAYDAAEAVPALDVLVVEDDPVHAEIIQRSVKTVGLSRSLHHVPDGDLALDFVHHRGRFADADRFPRPGLILLDIRMPRMDGFEVLEHLKSDETTRDIPVLMISTSDRAEDIDRSLACGAIAFVTKPVDPVELSRTVCQTLAH